MSRREEGLDKRDRDCQERERERERERETDRQTDRQTDREEGWEGGEGGGGGRRCVGVCVCWVRAQAGKAAGWNSTNMDFMISISGHDCAREVLQRAVSNPHVLLFKRLRPLG